MNDVELQVNSIAHGIVACAVRLPSLLIISDT